MRRRTALAISLLAILIFAGVALAQPNCTLSRCLYMPVSLSGPPTPTANPPTVTPVPTTTPGSTTPFPPCDQNDPPLAVGAQAWMTVQNPARFSMTTVCVRLIEGQHVVPGAVMSATAHYKTKVTN